MTRRTRRCWAAACAAMALITPATAPAAHAPFTPPAGMVRVQGPYANPQYGFRFVAPPGLAVFRARAPAPNHGAVVLLGHTRQIEVSAAFDAPEYGSTTTLMSARLPQGDASRVHRSAAILGGRVAEEAAYRVGAQVHVLVVRHEGGVDDGVNYTVELTSTASAQRSDRATFDRLLTTFRFVARG